MSGINGWFWFRNKQTAEAFETEGFMCKKRQKRVRRVAKRIEPLGIKDLKTAYQTLDQILEQAAAHQDKPMVGRIGEVRRFSLFGPHFTVLETDIGEGESEYYLESNIDGKTTLPAGFTFLFKNGTDDLIRLVFFDNTNFSAWDNASENLQLPETDNGTAVLVLFPGQTGAASTMGPMEPEDGLDAEGPTTTDIWISVELWDDATNEWDRVGESGNGADMGINNP